MYTKQLPVEITREIFTYILLQHNSETSTKKESIPPCRYIPRRTSLYPNHAQSRFFRYGEDGQCICWQIDMLNVAMVCWSWYLISMEIMQSHHVLSLQDLRYSHSQPAPWLSLINYPSYKRNYPFRKKLVQILKDSQRANLAFNHQLSHLVIDFASFDTIRTEPSKLSRVLTKRKVHHSHQLHQLTELIQLCTQAQHLEIVCDAGHANLIGVSNQKKLSNSARVCNTDSLYSERNRILYASHQIRKAITKSGAAIRRLDFIGYNPIQRCPCCASKDWDQFLGPLIHVLSLETVVLQHVLPSIRLFEILADTQPQLRKLVFHKSMITRPKKTLTATEESQGFLTSISQIPRSLWKQLTCIEIYEDIEDANSWRSQRYLSELAECISPQLTEFVLQFETEEVNQKCLSALSTKEESHFSIAKIDDLNSPLNAIVSKCHMLKRLKLVNVSKARLS